MSWKRKPKKQQHHDLPPTTSTAPLLVLSLEAVCQLNPGLAALTATPTCCWLVRTADDTPLLQPPASSCYIFARTHAQFLLEARSLPTTTPIDLGEFARLTPLTFSGASPTSSPRASRAFEGGARCKSGAASPGPSQATSCKLHATGEGGVAGLEGVLRRVLRREPPRLGLEVVHLGPRPRARREETSGGAAADSCAIGAI